MNKSAAHVHGHTRRYAAYSHATPAQAEQMWDNRRPASRHSGYTEHVTWVLQHTFSLGAQMYEQISLHVMWRQTAGTHTTHMCTQYVHQPAVEGLGQ